MAPVEVDASGSALGMRRSRLRSRVGVQEALMSTTQPATSNARLHGLVVFVVSLVAGLGAYWFLFHFLPGTGTARLPAYPLALPLAGLMVGALEMLTGAPIAKIDQGWQRLPVYVQAPVALFGGIAFIYGLVKLVILGRG